MTRSLTVITTLLLANAALAREQLRDSNPQEIISDGYYNTLAMACATITPDQSAHIFDLIQRDKRFFTGPTDSLGRLYAGGGALARADIDKDRAQACAKLTPPIMRRVDDLAAGDLSVLRRPAP